MEEIIIEVTFRCNLDCSFCFNKYVQKNNEYTKDISFGKIKQVIDQASQLKIPFIRFTGGEPLLRKDIFDIFDYAKSKNFKEIRLNTNGLLIDEQIAKKLEKCIDNILIPINDYNPKDDSFKKKIKSFKILKKTNIKTIRSGTIGTSKNIKNLEKIKNLIETLNLDGWEVYRPISREKNHKLVSKNDINDLVKKLLKIKKFSGELYPIANAIPFCVLGMNNSENVSKISLGAKHDDGNCRLVLDPRGYFKPSYFINKKLSNNLDINDAWNNAFLKKIHSLTFLDKRCKKCIYLPKCKGGSRYDSKINTGSYFMNDSLMG